MAYKPSPNSLIHCAECGEDYSATYKRCPFCGAKNAPPAAPDPKPSPASEYEPEPSRSAAPADPDDTYVFDGQDLFDDKDEEDYAPVRSKGGKRLAGKPASNNPFANADINWPRMITFICSLVIIVAAMVIVFTVVYPQLRGNKNPPAADNSESPSGEVSDPGATVTYPGVTVSDPVGGSSAGVPPEGSVELKSFTTNTYGNDEDGFSLNAGGSWQMELTFNPTTWSGEVTYSVSDERYATVSAGGNVVNVNKESVTHKVVLTIVAGGLTKTMPVYCYGVTATQPPVSDPPPSQSPSGSGGVSVGKQGTIVNVGSVGLNVRSGPGRNHSVIDSLYDGNTINVLEDAGSGWYKISYIGTGGVTKEGYIMGDYISTN